MRKRGFGAGMKSATAVLLTAAMIFAEIPGTVATAIAEGEAALESEVITSEGLNPYWVELQGEELLRSRMEAENEPIVGAAETKYASTVEEAVLYLREQLADRAASAVINIPTTLSGTGTTAVKAFSAKLVNLALAHSDGGKSYEGDAITYDYEGYSSNTVTSKTSCTITYNFGYKTTAEQENTLREKITAVLQTLKLDGKSDLEKITAIHDYIITHCRYDQEGLDNDSDVTKYSAYGALLEGEAVCQGYATLFYRMCMEEGISCRVITGTGYTSSGGGAHAWNIVELDEEYYYVDATWDDPLKADGTEAGECKTWFLLGYEETEGTVNGVPTTFNWFNRHLESSDFRTDEFVYEYPVSAVNYPYQTDEDLPDGLNADNYSGTYSYATTSGGTIGWKAENNKPRVMMYVRIGCLNSQNALSTLAEYDLSEVDLVPIVNSNYYGELNSSAVTDYKASYGSDQMKFGYKSETYDNPAYYYLNEITTMHSYTYPLMVFIDKNNKVQAILDGAQDSATLEAYFKKYCGVTLKNKRIEELTYTISYLPNSGSGSTGTATGKTAGSSVKVVAPSTFSIAKTGYVFTEWNTNADGTGRSYQVGENVSVKHSNITLYAQWRVDDGTASTPTPTRTPAETTAPSASPAASVAPTIAPTATTKPSTAPSAVPSATASAEPSKTTSPNPSATASTAPEGTDAPSATATAAPVVAPEKDGWVSVSGKWMYFQNKTAVTGWKKLSGKWYFFDKDGYMKTGWVKDGGKWYFFDKDGYMKTGWVEDGGTWYYFEKSGVMHTGWQQSGKKWYYFEKSGAMHTGWLQSGGKWYYFEKSGAMKTGWVQSGKKWYYFEKTGVMKTGWLQSGGKWYYFSKNGAMQTGWLKIGTKWYYFNAGGDMVTGKKKIGSKTYTFDKNGVLK